MAGVDEVAVAVTAASRGLRRQLRPMTWVTLEEVALEAVAEGGQLVARTSARLVAERLGVTPAAAAGALRILRERGLLVSQPDGGAAARFDLSGYRLEPVAGLAVVTAGPWMAVASPRDRAGSATHAACVNDGSAPSQCCPSSLPSLGQEPPSDRRSGIR